MHLYLPIRVLASDFALLQFPPPMAGDSHLYRLVISIRTHIVSQVWTLATVQNSVRANLPWSVDIQRKASAGGIHKMRAAFLGRSLV